MDPRSLIPTSCDELIVDRLFVRGSGGRQITEEERVALLAAIRAGKPPPQLVIEAVTFNQRPGVANRNFHRFKPEVLDKIGRSFTNTPFLRDHRQWDIGHRGGTVLQSTPAPLANAGGVEFHQVIELVKPWAMEGVLDGTIDRFSIGWHNIGPILCSICRAEFWSGDCWHFPGERDEETGELCEIISTDAEGVEVSAVSVPAVVGTGIEAVREAARAYLAATRAAHTGRAPKEKAMSKFASILPLLSLSHAASDEAIVEGVKKLHADLAEERMLRGAETKARETFEARALAAETKLAERSKVDHDAELDRLLETVRVKVGQKLGADGKPVRGGTEEEAFIIEVAATSLERARALVAKIPQRSPVGRPLLSSLPAGQDPTPAFTPEHIERAARMGLTVEDLNQEAARRAKKGA